jgi:hypothetical protein
MGRAFLVEGHVGLVGRACVDHGRACARALRAGGPHVGPRQGIHFSFTSGLGLILCLMLS